MNGYELAGLTPPRREKFLPGDEQRFLQKLTEATWRASNAREVAQLLEDTCGVVALLRSRADWTTAQQCVNVGKSIAKKHSLSDDEACLSVEQAAVFLEIGDLTTAAHLLREAFATAESKKWKSFAALGMGVIHFLRREYPKGLDLTKRSYQTFKELDDPIAQTIALNNWGRAVAEQGHIKSGEQTLDRAEALAEKRRDQHLIHIVHLTRAEILLARNQGAEAIRLATKAYKYFVNQERPVRAAEALRLRGDAHYESGHLAKAEQDWTEALRLCREHEVPYGHLKERLENLEQSYAEQRA